MSQIRTGRPLPQIPQNATLDQIADFLQFYGQLDVNDLAEQIQERHPFLKADEFSKYALVTGWLRPQMEFAAIALRQYVVDRQENALGGAA